ncbi:unnamed protein product [Phytophthora lilii]|uniref:Unnamed protein product n=1 Tax=Phytophthora lilii TaxID=2077276 RepID=A0A9W6U9W0_9STRA|nr:unnamed protein product [Phytophthora lilii]
MSGKPDYDYIDGAFQNQQPIFIIELASIGLNHRQLSYELGQGSMKLFVPFALAFTLLFPVSSAKYGEETKTINDLYADAVAEGGQLVPYHGGDMVSQGNGLHDAFVKRFPNINFTVVVDYSKFHDVRIDNQLETDTLVPDAVVLQTLQDFTRWTKAVSFFLTNQKGFPRSTTP